MKKIWKKAFTLVEIMVAVTIFWMVMLSVMGIYIVSTESTYKSEVNRIVHENVKNIITDLNNVILKEGINWVSSSIIWNCELPDKEKTEAKIWFIFCSWDYKYSLKKRSNTWTDLSVSNISECSDKNPTTNNYNDCYLVKEKIWFSQPVTNNLVTVREANFRVTNFWAKKVTIYLKLQPSSTSWVRKSHMEQSVFEFQTTISARN